MGISLTCFALNVVATSARSVLSCGASAVTSTVSDVPPTWNCKGTFEAASAETRTSFCSLALNPGASTRTVYTSGIKWVTEFPLSLVVVVSDVPLRWSRTVTLAFATAAPCGSVTVPMMLPYTACPHTGCAVSVTRQMQIVSIAAIESCFAIFSASAVLNRQDLPDNRGPEFAGLVRATLQEMQQGLFLEARAEYTRHLVRMNYYQCPPK